MIIEISEYLCETLLVMMFSTPHMSSSNTFKDTNQLIITVLSMFSRTFGDGPSFADQMKGLQRGRGGGVY